MVTLEKYVLNPDRVSVLDIDTDIEGGRRAQTLQILRDAYGQNRVANVVTFGTEKSKSAILTAAKGLGIDHDEALYIASLVPADRGQLRSLKECYYGDEDKGFYPIADFVDIMNSYPELWQVAQYIEGLVCRVGEHAGGVIFVDEDFTKSTALMKVPNGDIVTQYDLHDAEKVSLIKIDLLSVECLDKIHTCIDLLTQDGYINNNLSLKEKYEQTIGIYNLERTNPQMWEMVWNHKIQSLFQMEKQSGIQGIELIKPKSVDELAVLNSVIRLMPTDKNAERPLELWAKYRKDISLWIQEMQNYGLTEEEIQWLSNHSAVTDGVCESQEGLMSLVQEPRLGGNSLSFADKCRKGIAKKQGSLFQECEDTFYKNIAEQGLSQKLAHYVWDVLLRVQRGYSFNRSHCLAYSLVALQEMNLCFKYPVIYWNCACLITDSGGVGSGTNYDKIAQAIGKIKNEEHVQINLPDINTSGFEFKPDAKNNVIWCGLKSLLNVGDDVIERTINLRPYSSPKDYLQKVKPGKQAMISLIKGGAFDNMEDRKFVMTWYIWETCDKKSRITLQNMPGLIKNDLLPEENEEQITARRVYEFNRYLKAICGTADKKSYQLDTRADNFLTEMNYEHLIDENNSISVSEWNKIYDNWMNIFRQYFSLNQKEILDKLNKKIFSLDWEKYALGSLSKWEMEVLCFYYHEHELTNVDNSKYGLVDFFSLPENPIVQSSRKTWQGKVITKYKLHKICGTCIAKNKDKATVTLLTTSGVVNVKFRKEYFALFDKQVSEIGADGKKHRLESSWFNRGSMIIVQGIRNEDTFLPKKYSDTIGHQLYKILEVKPNGELELQVTRAKGELDEED